MLLKANQEMRGYWQVYSLIVDKMAERDGESETETDRGPLKL